MILSFCVLCTLCPIRVHGQIMDNAMLYEILQSVTDSLKGSEGMWQLKYSDRVMLVITDEYHDRMRMISPVEVMEEVSQSQMEAAMIANFHSTLDVRYAISDEILWAVFIHPLKALSESQVRDAFLQVYRAAETFGSTYSSSDLIFPGAKSARGSGAGARKKM